jgi:hypothetical protein
MRVGLGIGVGENAEVVEEIVGGDAQRRREVQRPVDGSPGVVAALL